MMSKAVPKHHLFVFGHNPFQKLGPQPLPTPGSSTTRTARSIISTPTDVLPHLVTSCERIIRSSLGLTGLSAIDENVEIKAEFIWSCYSSSLVKVRWFQSGSEHDEVIVDRIPFRQSAATGKHVCLALRSPDSIESLSGNKRLTHVALIRFALG
jgi:hypothetical protein